MIRARLGAALLGVMSLAACATEPAGSVEPRSASMPTVSPASETPRTTPTFLVTTTTGSSTSIAISAPSTVSPASVRTVLGPVSFVLPVEAVADPRPRSPRPDIVAEVARFMVPGRVNVGVTIETIIPPMPVDELVGEFDANGLRWQVFDSGPRNGSLIIAMAMIETSSVLVSAQNWTWEATDVPRAYVESLARTLRHEPP